MLARMVSAQLIVLLATSWVEGQNQNLGDENLLSKQTSNDLSVSSLRVSRGSGVLPNDHGQIWREYDLQPYTSRIKDSQHPEQAIVDWILRETGTDIWFTEPLGLLNADRHTLTVYHTPQVHQTVGSVVNRFLNAETQSHAFSMRLVTVGSPNWRAKLLHKMQSVSTQTPGTEAWISSKEEAVILLSELRKRNDYREHNTPDLLIQNGQHQTIERLRPQQYIRTVRMQPNSWPGYDLDSGLIEEGFTLMLTPLMSVDGRTVDAVIKAHVDQIEKMESVYVDVPTAVVQRQRVQIQVPRISSWHLHERFRWPADKVLVISRGVVATPTPSKATPFLIGNRAGASRSRADTLLFIESTGPAAVTPTASVPGVASAPTRYQGRY